ncbi:hypothetical protein J1N35_034926 [Gossypium stocksii]|uniref:Uncharacterized protein n=1 Tax=Gossypium stocksii TaxID=47602 RepID=A0A9D3UTA2_9ROSI|nr:hypothetical protein J1N35_034926 [Gossypium stocksii]
METAVHRSISTLKEPSRGEEVVDVGKLDFEKHSTMSFCRNKEPLNTNSPAPMRILGSRKGTKLRGKISKQNKSIQGSNVRFKNHGSLRVSLKKSMEQLAETFLL